MRDVETHPTRQARSWALAPMPAGASQTARGLRNSSNPTGPIVGTCTDAIGRRSCFLWITVSSMFVFFWIHNSTTSTWATGLFEFVSIEIEVETLSLAFQPQVIDIDSAHVCDMMFGNSNQGEGWEWWWLQRKEVGRISLEIENNWNCLVISIPYIVILLQSGIQDLHASPRPNAGRIVFLRSAGSAPAEC